MTSPPTTTQARALVFFTTYVLHKSGHDATNHATDFADRARHDMHLQPTCICVCGLLIRHIPLSRLVNFSIVVLVPRLSVIPPPLLFKWLRFIDESHYSSLT